MRNDYFTTTELSKLLHMATSTVLKHANQPGYFPGIKTGSKMSNTIIPKDALFDWYFKAYNTGKIRELFPQARIDHAAIMDAYRQYKTWKNQNNEALRREYVRNKRPAYRRKGSYDI